MAPLTDPRQVAEIMLSWLDLDLDTCVELQTLWAGYGHICAVTAKPRPGTSSPHPLRLILKLISPPGDPRHMDEGHLRKMLSYEVEQVFYHDVAPRLTRDSAVADCLASTLDMKGKPGAGKLQGLTVTLMTDLRIEYPVAGEKRAVLSERQADAAIDWLATFHAASWASLPEDLTQYLLPPLEEEERRVAGTGAGSKLWLNGGYTYLATRQKEFKQLERDDDDEWSAQFCLPMKGSQKTVAQMVADFLTPCGRDVETYIHGDVKSENLFTTKAGDRAAFFDFQYVGVGLGVCDLAKLFTCSVPVEMLAEQVDSPKMTMGEGERRLLEQYRTALPARRPPGRGPAAYDWDVFVRHWEAALVDWCRFQASWSFWGNTEWLEARVRSILADKEWVAWLKTETKKA